VLDRLPPGDYGVLASKRGFITPGPGQNQNAVEGRNANGELVFVGRRASQARIIPVSRGQDVDAVDLTLGREASIEGTIVDEFGEPMQDVVINALELRAMGGRMRALRASLLGNRRTDDRGRYRLFGLQPGVYVVQAVAGDVLSATHGYVPLFYPGTPAIDSATPTKLDIDAAAAGIDLTLLTQPTRRVRGTLFDPAGNPIGVRDGLFDRAGMSTTVMVALATSSQPGGIQTEPVRTASNADGTFAFNNIAPGNYIVQAAVNGPAVPAANVPTSQQFAEALVTIAGDDPPPIELRLSRGATLIGRVVYEGIAESFPPYAGIQMTVVPAADRDPLLAASTNGFALLSDNTFEYRGVFGRTFLSVRPRGANWYVKSITYRGQDLADSAFDFGVTETFRDVEIVISGAGAMVTGRVTDDRALPIRDYTVAFIPTDRSKWTIRSRWLKIGRAMQQDGAFRVTGIVPGDYWVVAVDRLEDSEVAGDLQNPEVLEALASRAQRITLGGGQSQILTLRLLRR
jgi:hypothetical protein